MAYNALCTAYARDLRILCAVMPFPSATVLKQEDTFFRVGSGRLKVRARAATAVSSVASERVVTML